MVIRLSKRLSGAFLFILFAAWLLFGIQNQTLSFFMPRLYGCLLIALSVSLIVQYWYFARKYKHREGENDDILVLDFHGFLHSDTLKILIYLVMITVYYAAVSFLGFFTSTVIFLILSYLFLGIHKLGVYFVSLLMFGVLYGIFDFFLNVRFPHGWLY